MSYYDNINQGDKYMCDRCNVAQLRHDEYMNNVRDIEGSDDHMRYCDECRNFIIIRKFKCLKCLTTGTLRNERILPKVCCKQEVSWSA
jgi:hypothetical protein